MNRSRVFLCVVFMGATSGSCGIPELIVLCKSPSNSRPAVCQRFSARVLRITVTILLAIELNFLNAYKIEKLNFTKAKYMGIISLSAFDWLACIELNF